MAEEKLFLSCDWGTSSFRLRLVDASRLTVIAEEANSQGISITFDLWKRSGKDEGERVRFYQSVILEHILTIQKSVRRSLEGIPLIISGMASSSIGMTELPYKELPFLANGSDLLVSKIKATPFFPYPVSIISGVKSGNDVMRGEEIQIAGCLPGQASEEQLFILPGTHSKHVRFKNGHIYDFSTYMTGELFSLLSTKSVLANAVEPGGEFTEENNAASFKKGVLDSINANLLNAFFLIRTNDLFKKLSRQENFYYLSGLLIGMELKDLKKGGILRLVLVSNHLLKPYYLYALQVLEIAAELIVKDVDEAILEGHFQIYKSGI